MYVKKQKTISQQLAHFSQKRNRLGSEIQDAKREMELAQMHFNQAQGAWIDVCAHSLRAAELKYAQLIRMAKAEERLSS
ncbi:MAG: DUF2508 family protein [Clostridia bacterium]|nr:DUF2508 family protein [Clostridia bacterium]